MFTFLTKDLITDEKRDTSKIVKIKTLYWNRTNIYCFEDRCTNHYTKSANKVFFILYVQVKRLELLQLLRHFILSEACLPFQHTCHCIYCSITFFVTEKETRKKIKKVRHKEILEKQRLEL
jgi:hypothetical protein